MGSRLEMGTDICRRQGEHTKERASMSAVKNGSAVPIHSMAQRTLGEA